MAFKVLFMWEQGVYLTEPLYMVMNLLSSRNIEKQGFSPHALGDHERRVQNQIKMGRTKRNQASMWTLLCQYII